MIKDAKKKIAFLDRDGVINIDKGYVYKIADFQFIDGVIDALRGLKQLGFELVVITNQAGIARGFYSEADLRVLHEWMENYLREREIELLSIEYCPHHIQGTIERYASDCHCRKPNPGMIENITSRYEVDRAGSILVGDKDSDIIAGKKAGIGSQFLISSEYSRCDLVNREPLFESLSSVVNHLGVERA